MSKQLEYYCQACDSRWYRATNEEFNQGRECRGCHRQIFPTLMNVPIPPLPVNPLELPKTTVVTGAWSKPLVAGPKIAQEGNQTVPPSRGKKNPTRKATRSSSKTSQDSSAAGSSEVLVVETSTSTSTTTSDSASPIIQELSESTVTAEASQTLSLEEEKNSFTEEAKNAPGLDLIDTKKPKSKSRRKQQSSHQVWNQEKALPGKTTRVPDFIDFATQETVKFEVGSDRFFRFFALNSDYGPGIAGAIAATREEAIERIIAKYFGNVAIHSMRNQQIAQNFLHGVDPVMSQRNLIGAPLDSLDGWEEQQQSSTDLIQVAAHLKEALIMAPYTEDPIKDCAFYMAGPSKTTITRYCQQ